MILQELMGQFTELKDKEERLGEVMILRMQDKTEVTLSIKRYETSRRGPKWDLWRYLTTSRRSDPCCAVSRRGGRGWRVRVV